MREEYFDHKYRVRRGLFGKSVLQVLVKYKRNIADDWYVKWVDVSYKEAPRALTTEIKE